MASSSITSWQIDGETMKTVTDFLFLGSKIIADADCSHIKRRLLLWRTAMTNLDSILKSRDITLLTKICIVRAMVFPVVIYAFESWTIKKAVCRRIDAFELWCWRRLLRVPGQQGDQTSPSQRKPTLNIHWQDWCWSWSSNTLDTWIWRANSLEKTLMLGKIEGRRKGEDRGWDGWMASWIQWTWVWANSGRWWRTGNPGRLQFMGSQSLTPLSYLNKAWIHFQDQKDTYVLAPPLSFWNSSTELKCYFPSYSP